MQQSRPFVSLLNKETLCLTIGRLYPTWSGRQLHNPFFLIGVARSGTTIASDLLGTHPHIANWSELNQLWDPQGYPWDASDRSRPPDWVDPLEYVQSWWADTSPVYRHTIRGALGAYQFFSRKPVLLNKSPMHTFRVPQILEMIPEARFVYLVRDGRAVVYSYARKIAHKIETAPEAFQSHGLAMSFDQLIEKLAHFWVLAIRQLEIYRTCLNSDQLLELRYEDLCSNPRETLISILDFIGVPPELFEWRQTEVLENRNFKWRETLSKPIWQKAERIMADELARWGYRLSQVETGNAD